MMQFTLAFTQVLAMALALLISPSSEDAPLFSSANPQFGRRGRNGDEVKLVERFDKDGDKRLNTDERKAARDYLTGSRFQGNVGRFRGPMRGSWLGRAEPGAKISPADVASGGNAPLYDPATLRTFFLQFENADWEQELEVFKNTDVEVPATLTIDGRIFRDVGVHFRGQSSYSMVMEGWKRSLNLSLDYVHKDQAVGGYRTLNLLNSHMDPTYLRTVLFNQIAREYIPSPKANYARVVINGENWGIYVNAQQFNKDFTRDFFNSTEGARWKVPGSPSGRAGLEYLGDDPAIYRQLYEIKSKDDPESWKTLIALCRTLNEEPVHTLEDKLSPMLDIDGVLKFLALEIVMVNSDGYWVRASDYSIYRDEKGRFHLIPHDTNETFSGSGRGMSRRRFGRTGATGTSLDPLTGVNDPTLPLLSNLLAVPKLRERYLEIVRDIAQKWLDWDRLGPIARRHQAVIAADIKEDTKKLDSTEAFESGLKSLEAFVTARRAFLLSRTAPNSR